MGGLASVSGNKAGGKWACDRTHPPLLQVKCGAPPHLVGASQIRVFRPHPDKAQRAEMESRETTFHAQGHPKPALLTWAPSRHRTPQTSPPTAHSQVCGLGSPSAAVQTTSVSNTGGRPALVSRPLLLSRSSCESRCLSPAAQRQKALRGKGKWASRMWNHVQGAGQLVLGSSAHPHALALKGGGCSSTSPQCL